VVISLERGADCLRMVQLMSLYPNIAEWFYFYGTGLPRLSEKRGRQTGVVVVVFS